MVLLALYYCAFYVSIRPFINHELFLIFLPLADILFIYIQPDCSKPAVDKYKGVGEMTFVRFAFLVVLAVSFYICVSGIALKSARKSIRLLAACFGVVLFFSAAAFILPESYPLYDTAVAADIILLVSFTVVVLLNPDRLNTSHALPAVFIFSAAITFAYPHTVLPMADILHVPSVHVVLFTVFLMSASLYVSKKALHSVLFATGLVLAAISVITSILFEGMAGNLFRTASYTVFFICFNRFLVLTLIKNYEKAKKELEAANTDVENLVRKRTYEIERSNKRIADKARIDPLSGVMNRNAVITHLENLISEKRDFCLLLFDIDNFKEINDFHGHVTGDACIKKTGSVLRDSIRSGDRAGRYGGDEFLVLLPGTTLSQAMYTAERLRKNIEVSGKPPITVSIGVASYPNDSKTKEGLLKFADEGLYISKKKGRNSVTHKGLY